jgi:hypothetical protein
VAGFCEHGNEPVGSNNAQGISWPSEELLASQEGLYFVECLLVS